MGFLRLIMQNSEENEFLLKLIERIDHVRLLLMSPTFGSFYWIRGNSLLNNRILCFHVPSSSKCGGLQESCRRFRSNYVFLCLVYPSLKNNTLIYQTNIF